MYYLFYNIIKHEYPPACCPSCHAVLLRSVFFSLFLPLIASCYVVVSISFLCFFAELEAHCACIWSWTHSIDCIFGILVTDDNDNLRSSIHPYPPHVDVIQSVSGHSNYLLPSTELRGRASTTFAARSAIAQEYHSEELPS
ncbi:hypothetical protein BDR04DRAFT_619871 [Suillus decipiens]|nr:hypothetical protein BDR04DRAFT_619871 [Suillus decipiens]